MKAQTVNIDKKTPNAVVLKLGRRFVTQTTVFSEKQNYDYILYGTRG